MGSQTAKTKCSNSDIHEQLKKTSLLAHPSSLSLQDTSKHVTSALV
jgi:hypothetical protein